MKLGPMFYRAGENGEEVFEGNLCPVCLSPSVEIDFDEDNGKSLNGDGYCSGCKAKWRVYYKVIGYRLYVDG